jgi:hypothetical protein
MVGQSSSIGTCAALLAVTVLPVPEVCAISITSAGGVTEIHSLRRSDRNGSWRNAGQKAQRMSAGYGVAKSARCMAMESSMVKKLIVLFSNCFEPQYLTDLYSITSVEPSCALIHHTWTPLPRRSISPEELTHMRSVKFVVADCTTSRSLSPGTSIPMGHGPAWSASGTVTGGATPSGDLGGEDHRGPQSS